MTAHSDPSSTDPRKKRVTSVPLTYNGIRYRSHLEADWAAMLDHLGIYFEYEPEPYRLPSRACYTPDFFIPNQRVYLEAKGPHNERLYKPQEFAAVLRANEYPNAFLVVLLRPAGPTGCAMWEAVDGRQDPMLTDCPGCGGWAFADIDEHGDYYCRQCGCLDVLPGATFPGVLRMAHAPRAVA